MSALFFALPGNEGLAERLAELTHGALGKLQIRNFPDGETYLRFETEPKGHDIVLVCTLAHPDAKIPPLLFAARAARELGAARIGLVAPYLCYMRQDRPFHAGEAITSRSFATLLSREFDWLVTVDPHLHRYKSLEEIYTIPALALHAGAAIADWIKNDVSNPFLIGPDAESRQWVEAVARTCQAPSVILTKTRTGDDAVRETPLSVSLAGYTPVVLDDIVASGATLFETLALLPAASPAVLIAIHALCGTEVMERFAKAGAQLVTCNTVASTAAKIDIVPLLAKGVAEIM